MKPHSVLLESIILNRWDYADQDLIVSFFSKEKGKLRGIAKGGKKSRKRFGGALDLFSQATLRVLEKKRGDLYFLEEAHLVRDFGPIKTRYEAILMANGLLYLVDQLYPEAQKSEAGFAILEQGLGFLEKKTEAQIFWSSLLRHLSALGWAPRLQGCMNCQKSLKATEIFFDARQGGFFCADCEGGRKSPSIFHVSARLWTWLQSQQEGFNDKNPLSEADLETLQPLLIDHLRYQAGIDLDWKRFLDGHFDKLYKPLNP